MLNEKPPSITDAKIKFFNPEDVNYLIGKLKDYHDAYSAKLVKVLRKFLRHKSFDKFRVEIDNGDFEMRKPLHLMWDINTRIGFLEVIYPVD